MVTFIIAAIVIIALVLWFKFKIAKHKKPEETPDFAFPLGIFFYFSSRWRRAWRRSCGAARRT